MKRLFTINGPTQMLAILSIIDFKKTSVELVEDYLAIYYLDSIEKNPYIHEIINKMAALHTWKKIILLEGKELESNELLREFDIQNEQLDELYLVRNWTNYNEKFQNTFPKARIIIYGDYLGIFDSIVSNEYRIDEVNLILPILSLDNKYNKGLIKKVKIIPKQHLLEIIDRIKNVFNPQHTYLQPINLFISSYYSKSYFMSLEEEIHYYFELIQENLNKEERLILKPHPRDTGEIVNALRAKLIDYGFKVEIIEDSLKAVPVEVLIFLLKINSVIGTISGAMASVKFLRPDVNIVLENLKNIEKYDFTEEVINGLKINHSLITQVTPNVDDVIYIDKSKDMREQIYSKNADFNDLLNFAYYQQINNKSIVVYGASGRFLNLEKEIIEKGIDLAFLIDSDKSKEGIKVSKYDVISKYTFQKILQRKSKDYFVIITSSYSQDIEFFLKSLGLKKYINYICI